MSDLQIVYNPALVRLQKLDAVERVYRGDLAKRGGAPSVPMLHALRDLRASLEPAPVTPVASDAPQSPPGADIAAMKSVGAGDSNQPYLVHLHGGWSTACGIPLRAVVGTTSPVLSTVTCPACCLAAEVDG